MRVLIGTTNPSKIKRFEELLHEFEIEFLTLSDLNISDEPEEIGKTPEENAVIKARFYGKYCDLVICNDSGLYFTKLDLNDKRQPGLQIRTPYGKRLDDSEMIEYYQGLISSLGGCVEAYYLDGIAVYNHGKVTSYMDEELAQKTSSFYVIDKPSLKRHPGWPLDSLSVYKDSDDYFVDKKEFESKDSIIKQEYKERIVSFLKNALRI